MTWNIDVISVFAERSERAAKIEKSPAEIAALELHYSSNPVDFINDWGCTVDPRLDNPLIPFILFPKQKEFIEWLYDAFTNRKDGEVLKARDAGATWLAGAFSAWALIFHPNTSIGFGSRKQDLVDKRGDMDSIFEKINMFLTYLPDIFKPKFERHLMKILNNENGAAITGEAGDNIGRGGRNRMYFVDEAAFIERPEAMDAALSMNTDCRIEISTPNGTGNPFYRKVHSGEYRVFQFSWRDDPRKNDAWYREQIRKRDPIIVAQEVDCDFEASTSDNVVDGNDVKSAKTRVIDFEIFGPKIIGCDVARFGDDKTAICLRQGKVLHWIETHRQLTTMQVVGILVDKIRNFNPDAVVIDTVGMGEGVYDRLVEQFDSSLIHSFKSNNKARNYQLYYQRDAEAWHEMRNWFAKGAVIPNIDGCEAWFTARKYSFNSSGQIVLEKKSDMKKRGVSSPDEADCVAMTFSDDFDYYNPFEEYDENSTSERWY